MIGGWNEGARNLANLAGISVEEYLANPVAGVVRANKCLGVDGMVGMMAPTTVEEIRSGHCQESVFGSRGDVLQAGLRVDNQAA